MAENMGVSMEEAETRFQAFHDGAPYIRKLSNLCMAQVERTGQIRTIGGRLRRFNLWEPWGEGDALPREEALQVYGGGIKRAFVYKALNALIQGGAADIMKMAMVEGYEQGLEIPVLTVHDELDFGDVDADTAHAWAEVMCEVFSDKLKVKMHVDVERGPNWGNVQ